MFSELLRTLAKLFNSLLVFSEEVMGGREGGRGGSYSNRVRRLSGGGSLDRTFSGMGGWRWVYDFVLVCV